MRKEVPEIKNETVEEKGGEFKLKYQPITDFVKAKQDEGANREKVAETYGTIDMGIRDGLFSDSVPETVVSLGMQRLCLLELSDNLAELGYIPDSLKDLLESINVRHEIISWFCDMGTPWEGTGQVGKSFAEQALKEWEQWLPGFNLGQKNAHLDDFLRAMFWQSEKKARKAL